MPKPKKVVLHIRPDPKKPKERMCLSEHPFGMMKWYHDRGIAYCAKAKKKPQPS